jgi:hypothetical protein
MNHVPDDVLDDIDTLGEQFLVGSPPRVDGRLRDDLSVTIVPDESGRTARIRYETEHTQAPPVLRDRGSFVTTIVDGIDSRLRSWGIEPPEAYEHTESVGRVHHYEGRLRFP